MDKGVVTAQAVILFYAWATQPRFKKMHKEAYDLWDMIQNNLQDIAEGRR